MIRLPTIFSDHALYLQSSPLTVRGKTDARSITLTLKRDGADLLSVCGAADAEGRFAITFTTPAASYESYEIVLASDTESVTLTDILFGELWLASGQSNMSFPNHLIDECDEMLASLVGKRIRVHYAPNLIPAAGEFPRNPLEENEGRWGTETDTSLLQAASACATSFAQTLYTYLNSDRAVPVGILSLARGALPIESYLIEESYRDNPAVMAHLAESGRLPEASEWNAKGDQNFKQTGCEYNYLIAPALGVRCRGMLWYQGESNTDYEERHGVYATLLRELHDSYKARFAPSEDSPFPILSTLLYPWRYGTSGGCALAYTNRALTELAVAEPTVYPAVPICDLKMRWAFSAENHPIHPTNKYPLGERMARLAETAVYGRSGRNVQKLPAHLSSVRRRDGKLYLTFSDVGSGLYVKNGRLRGIYIRSKEGVYQPARCEIVNKRTLALYHPFIKAPYHAAYACSSWEHETNLFAGEYPVFPFCTERMRPTDPPLRIQVKNWMNTELDSEVVIDNFCDGYRDAFRQPIFYPAEGSTVCFDSDFSLSGRSIRVHGRSASFGVTVRSTHYHELDLFHYASLRASILNTKGLTVRLILSFRDGGIHAVVGEKLAERRGDFCDYAFDLTALPDRPISEMEFRFDFDGTNHTNRYANLDCLDLVPKR